MATTGALVTASLLSKLLLEYREPVGAQAHELLRQAEHWHNVASRDDADVALRLQHAAKAEALIHAARTLAADASLERMTGLDVPRYAQTLQKETRTLRQTLQASLPTRVGQT